MPYKTILANLSSSERANAVLDVAMSLVEKQDAHLIGLHVIPVVSPDSIPRYPIPNDMLILAQTKLQAEADKIERIFADATKSIAARCEWRLQRARDSNLAAHIRYNTMTVDLVVTSQEIGYPLDGRADLASDLVLAGGRPVLIVPAKGRFQSVGERVVVGWKPGREATRAIFDAVPLIQTAGTVHVVSVNEGNEETNSVSQFTTILARHGIKATAVEISDDSNAGEALLDQVSKFNADLLVMGCYGRSRLLEIILGGATRHVLKNMTVPVLMSH